MAKQSNNRVIKVLIIFFVLFFVSVAGYEYIQYGSIFNNSEHYRKIYADALSLKNTDQFSQAYTTLNNISPRYEAYDAVLFQQAQCATKVGDEASVQKSLKSLIIKYPQSYLYIPAKYDLAKSFLRSGDKTNANNVFQNIVNNHKNTDYETGSYYYLAELNKNNNLQLKYWKKYVEQSQDGRFSLECAENIIKSNNELSALDNYYLGLVFLKAQRYDSAIAHLLKAPFEKAWYYLAQANLAKNNTTKAKEQIRLGLQKHTADFSQDELATIMLAYANSSSSKIQAWDELSDISIDKTKIEDIALFNKAKYLPTERAMVLYRKIASHHLKGDYASEAIKKLFWNAYKNNQLSKAKDLAIKHINNFTNTKSAPEMHYWLGKIYEIEKDQTTALKIYNKILAKYPDNYYAMRAFGRITHLTKGYDYGWKLHQKGTYLEENFEPELPYNYSEIKTKFGATIAELLLVQDFATLEYFEDFDEPFIQSWIYYKKGLRSTSTTIARNAMEEYTEKPDRTDKKWRLIYPCYFSEEINKYSMKNQLTPFLLISLIREESYFNPLALSSSNAVGLTQILPSTAKEVSSRKGYGKINEFLLFNPETNIKYGAAYLSQIRQQFKNNDVYTVASYNGGAGAVSSWVKKGNYKDLDEFIENIPYPETQNYVKKVFRSYWNYVRLYSE